MGELFEGYATTTGAPSRPSAAAWDEMFERDGTPRRAYHDIHATLEGMTQDDLRGRTAALADSYLAQGVTFDFAGEERPFPLDAVPRVVEHAEWTAVERGVKQRVKALEAFLADVYGPQTAIPTGSSPRVSSRARATSTGRPAASTRPTACASRSAAST